MIITPHLKWRFGAALVLAALAGHSAAAPPPSAPSDRPADYAYSLPLSVASGGVAALRLPQAVYLHAQSATLDDVRLFDRLGNKLPFTLRPATETARTSRKQMALNIFPVQGGASREAEADGLDIRTGSDGRLLSVTARSKAAAANAATSLQSLILEVGASDAQAAAPISALHFRLPPGTDNYNAQVWLEVSDDLKQWSDIGPAALNWLVNSSTQTLANDSIAFEPRRFRYARLSWKEGTPLLFAGVTAESVSRSSSAAPAESLVLQAAPGKMGQDLVYDSALAIPVEKVGLVLSEQNVVLPSVLGQYVTLPPRQLGESASLRFEALLRATFYQITQSGQQRSSGDLPVAPMHVAQWVLRPENGGAAGKPALRLTWTPASLVFLANGNAPYTLAFGRERAAPAALGLAQVAPGFTEADLLALPQATAGALAAQATAPPAAAAAAAGLSPTLGLAALWGVLLLGLAVLGFFVWRLLQQMKAGEPPK